MVWEDMAGDLRNCPAVSECAIFLPQRKIKMEASLASSLRTQGPILRALSYGTLERHLLEAPRPVIMGPCVRRDDHA
jgi:hypothetical protein